MPKIQHITSNSNGVVRKDQMEGREYTVVPMVMLTEGVHSGSEGPLFYSATELAKAPFIWNHKPVVVYHPEINGVGVSACDPAILTAQKIGVIMNTVFEPATEDHLARLKAEAWLEEDRVAAVDARVSLALANSNMVEVSTGVLVEETQQVGDFVGNGETEHYTRAAVNFKPDHLAVLPDQKGACSIADGAGLLRNQVSGKKGKLAQLFSSLFGGVKENEASHDDIRMQLHGVVRAKFEDGDTFPWIEDVFDDYFVYELNGDLFRLFYSVNDEGVVSVSGQPEKVSREVIYKAIENSQTNHEGVHMNRTDAVQALIDNKDQLWVEEDRTFLMALEESQFDKIIGNQEVPTTPGAPTTPVVPATPVVPVVPAVEQDLAANTSVDDWLAKAPAAVSDSIRAQLTANKSQREILIGEITANTVSTFTPEQLQAKDTDDLIQIANLAKVAVPPVQPLFAPQAGVQNTAPVTEDDLDKEPLVMPVMNFENN